MVPPIRCCSKGVTFSRIWVTIQKVLQLSKSPPQEVNEVFWCFEQEKFSEGADVSYEACKSFSQVSSDTEKTKTLGFSMGWSTNYKKKSWLFWVTPFRYHHQKAWVLLSNTTDFRGAKATSWLSVSVSRVYADGIRRCEFCFPTV